MKIIKSLKNLQFFKTRLRFDHQNLYSFCQITQKNSIKETENQKEIQKSNQIQIQINEEISNNQVDNYNQTKIIIDPQENKNKYLFETKYGLAKLINLNYPDSYLDQIKGFYYINNNVSSNYIKKILKEDQKTFIIFEPNTNYQNLQMLYESVKKLINQIYFGKDKKIKNPFRNCKNNAEIYHLHRRIQIEQKNMINRLLIVVNYGNYLNQDGSLRLRSQNFQSKQLLNQMGQFYENPLSKYQKHDFLISYNNLQGIFNILGILSAEEYEKQGIQIDLLQNKKIYPSYSVWTPTSQNYLKLLEKYLLTNKKKLSTYNTLIDLGCGTGILGFILAQNSNIKTLYGIDINQEAVKCAKTNAELLDIKDYNYVQSKIQDNFISKNNWPTQYDIISFNPPWLPAKAMNQGLDLGTYDPKELMIKEGFNFASKYLSQKGTMFLIYSDMAQIIGIQAKNKVENLCLKHNFVIRQSIERDFLDNQENSNQQSVLRNIKSQSKIYLYEIQRENC